MDRELAGPGGGKGGAAAGGEGGAAREDARHQAGPVDGCPFCPGGEAQLTDILQVIPAEAGGVDGAAPGAGPEAVARGSETSRGASRPDWQARAVLNRYPFLEPDEGLQEVLIETPRHHGALATLSTGERRAALRLYRARLRARLEEVPDAEVHLFRNQGREAGTSRSHPHAQMVVVRGRTPARETLERRQAAHHRETGECLVCAETVTRARHVAETEHFRVVTLHAPLDPCHLRVIPRAHGPSLAGVSDAVLDELADLLGRLAGAVEEATGKGAHNLLFHDHGLESRPDRHWHVEYRPRLSRTAGFEQMADVGVCPSDPEADAALLRSILEHGEASSAPGDPLPADPS